MKKQVITLTIGLALAASSAFAGCPVKTTEAAKPETNGCPYTASTPTGNKLTKEQMRQKFEEKMAKHREALYCKLGLTQEQKTKAEELDKKNRDEAKPLMEKVHQEKMKLRTLKENKAGSMDIYKQKENLRAAKKALHKHFEASQKSFEAILTKEQLTKFKAIREEDRAKMKEHCKCKDHFKHHHHHGPKFDMGKPPMPCPMGK